MRAFVQGLLSIGLICGMAVGAAQAQMSPGPIVGPAVTSEAARQSGAADSMSKKDMEQAKDKKDDTHKDMDKAKDKAAEDHKTKPN